MNGYCDYNKCKAVAEFETGMGDYCPYHYKVMVKKKGLTGKPIKLSWAEKEALKKTRLNPMFTIKLRGGKNDKNTKTRPNNR